jgi:hypothetical protein
MDGVETLPIQARPDKIFRLHNPSFRTAPPSCSRCGTPIANLQAWFATECPSDPEIASR